MRESEIRKIPGGWIKDPPDERDFKADLYVYAELPLPSKYLVDPSTIIYNQGSEPSCCGYACAGTKTDEEFLQHSQRYRFNGSWLYNECKKIDGIPDTPGTYIRVAMKILRDVGMRQAGTLCVKRQPDINWRIKAYFRLDKDSSDGLIKQVIFQYGSIVVGSHWYRSWVFDGEIFPVPISQMGGHAYRVCGWRDDAPAGWIIANSWGKNWGEKGIAVMPYDMFRENVLTAWGDVWKLIDA